MSARPGPPAFPLILAAFVLCAQAGNCHGDKIVLQTGRVIEGVIESESPLQVTVRTSAGLLSFSRQAIAHVQRQSNRDSHAIAVDRLLASGDLQSALTLMADSETSSSHYILSHRNILLEKANEHSPATAQRLLDVLDTQGDAAVRAFLSRYFAMRHDPAQALVQLGRTTADELRRSPADLADAMAAIEACGEWLLLHPDSELAGSLFQLLQQLHTSQVENTGTLILQFRAAQELARRGQFKEAMALTEKIEGPGKASLIRPHLDALLQRAEKEKNTTATAHVATLILDQFGQWYSGAGRQKLYSTAAMAQANLGDYESAAGLAARSSAEDPDAGAALQHRVEYMKRRASVAGDDLLSTYKLALWAREMGLLHEAAMLLERLGTEPLLAENVRLQLQLLEIDRGKAALSEIQKSYEAGDYPKVQRALHEFSSRYANPELQQKARELAELARYRQWSANRRLPGQAEAAYQHAERLYNQGKLEEALTHALQVITDYGGTGSAEKAAKLRERIELEARMLRNPAPRAAPGVRNELM